MNTYNRVQKKVGLLNYYETQKFIKINRFLDCLIIKLSHFYLHTTVRIQMQMDTYFVHRGETTILAIPQEEIFTSISSFLNVYKISNPLSNWSEPFSLTNFHWYSILYVTISENTIILFVYGFLLDPAYNSVTH